MGRFSKVVPDPNSNDYPKYFGLSGTALSRMIGFAAGSGFLLFGYDQGVMGGLLTLPSWINTFPEIDTTGVDGASSTSVLQGAAIGLYEIGCFAGAIFCLFYGDRFGRRPIIWIGTVIMIVGAVIQTASYDLTQLIIARIITGVGNGMHTSTIPMWQSECSPPHKRGMLIMIEGALITGGICMSYWIDFAFYWIDPSSRFASGTYDLADFPHADASWRIPVAFQIVLCIPTFITIWMPESPRWLMLRGRELEARGVLASLDELPMDDAVIEYKMQEIKETLELCDGVKASAMFKQGKERNFHRASLGYISQMFQQITGINLITYYAATILETNIGLDALTARIVAAANGTEYFLASFIAVWTIERFGRRKLMIFGAAGQCICMIMLAVLTSPAVLQPILEGPDAGAATNQGPAYGAVVFLFLFNTCFAIGWLGMAWLYPAEITPLPIRAAANGLSTSGNWLWNFMVVMITPVAFANIGHRTYIIFVVFNFIIAIVSWWIFPETAGRSLEEMDGIFAHASMWNPHDVVKIEKKTPRRYDTKGQRIVDPDNALAEDGNMEKPRNNAANAGDEGVGEKRQEGTLPDTRSAGSSSGEN